ncbi:TetR/AcrR family transcriptional regulator [Lapillicoccus jejuensis]|uniref:TetR/AcrR family transcriptional regulator n=1 Tax=Lapillicoccus jejuensis TaxID=402171 RepID=UPI00115456C9|nr:TetR/AcrR family transcriptional regulator [Lapillicoccus jejuensis]
MPGPASAPPPTARRADARRNADALVQAAASVFVERGVDAPVREVAARAGVGVGTIYRHFPTRAELVVAVYRHQVDELVDRAAAAPDPGASPADTLRAWVHAFAGFLVTKHGLAGALHADDESSAALHALVTDRLVPAFAALLDAAVEAGEARAPLEPAVLLRAIGNLCIGADPQGPVGGYDAHAVVDVLLDGLRRR